MEQWETTAHLGIGSNEDSPQERCIEGIQKLSLINAIRLIQCSNFYRTEPVGLKNQEWFINAVLEIRTGLSPYDLLSALQNIEWEMGRVKTVKNGPRVIDFDILLFNQKLISDEARLIIPHPAFHTRRFVLVPLNDVAPYVIHPVFGVSMRGLLDRCEDKSVVDRFADPVRFG